MSTLESRYRRLLALYPRSYRATHEDEMLGVLLAAASPGQRRPSMRDAIDLLGGAARVRLRRLRSLDSDWSDALAVVAVLAPILMLLGLSLPAAGLFVRAALNNYGTVTLVVLAGAAIAWPTVVVLSLTGHRRSAVTSAWILATLGLYVSAGGPGLEWGALGVLAAIAITVSRGLTRGVAVLGRSRLIAFVIGVALLSVPVARGWARVGDVRLPPWIEVPVAATLVTGLFLVMWVAFRINTPTARRTSILLALPLTAIALFILKMGLRPLASQRAETTVSVALPLVTFLGLLLTNLLTRGRERRREDTTSSARAQR